MINFEPNPSTDLKKEGKSFYWASFFLPKKSKINAGILYLRCRYVEDIADKQKRDFKKQQNKEKEYITSGLWAWSRHPNYFGEITLWAGLTLIALPVLSGWQLVTLISPIFVYVLLTRISGIPMLENRGMKKWGSDPEYIDYLERTPSLLLKKPNK